MLFPDIKLVDKIRFVCTYPFSLFISLIHHEERRKVKFLDNKPLFFLGKHYNLPLDNIINHIVYYFPLYESAHTIIDIGASFGTFPRIAKYFVPDLQIYSIEMVKESFEILTLNCSYLPKVGLSRVAIGKSRRKINYSYDPNFPEGGNIGLINYSCKGISSQTTLDNFIRQKGIQQISLLKIDAEGYEYSILSASTLALKKTETVLVEVQFDMSNIISVLSLLNRFNFTLDRFGALNLNLDGSIGSGDLIFKKRRTVI